MVIKVLQSRTTGALQCIDSSIQSIVEGGLLFYLPYRRYPWNSRPQACGTLHKG